MGENDSAVITLPANFSNAAREATMEAARLAGLNQVQIINEPTAVALYYLYEGLFSDGIYAVYDMGGGTFDISIVKYEKSFGGHKDVTVITSHGLALLGGMDFGLKLQGLVKKKFEQKTGGKLDLLSYNPGEAERDKRSLSKRDSLSCWIPPHMISSSRSGSKKKFLALSLKLRCFVKPH